MKKEIPNALLFPEISRMLDERHTVTLRLRGFSMRPFLEDQRDEVMLAKPRTVRKGDVVLAETSPGHYVLHRIVHLDGMQVLLRGDGNMGTEQCQRENLKGIAVGFYRKGRKTIDRTDGWKWKVYSHVWCSLFPLRRYLLAAYRRLWIPLFGPF